MPASLPKFGRRQWKDLDENSLICLNIEISSVINIFHLCLKKNLKKISIVFQHFSSYSTFSSFSTMFQIQISPVNFWKGWNFALLETIHVLPIKSKFCRQWRWLCPRHFKFQKFSVLPWRSNLPTNSKSTRFIWVFIVLGILYFPE